MIIRCSSPVYLCIHVCMIGNYLDILKSYRSRMLELDVLHHFQKVLIGIVGKDDRGMKDEVLSLFSTGTNHVEMVDFTEDIRVYERITLHCLHQRSVQEDFHVLYLHTKGVTHSPVDEGINVWRDKMLFFMLHYMTIALHYLEHDGADVLGIDFLKESPRRYSTHFSGNFWWSKASHIRKLNVPIPRDYLAPEMWICGIKGNRYISLYQTPNHNFHQGINRRNKNAITNAFTNNQFEPHLSKSVDIVLEDVMECMDNQWYGHPPHFVKVKDMQLTPGFHRVGSGMLSISEDPCEGKIKFWVMMNPITGLFSSYIEHQSIFMRTRGPIKIEYEYLSEESSYGTDAKYHTYKKDELTFDPNVETTIGKGMFRNEDPDYGQLKKWRFCYKDHAMELVEHQTVIIAIHSSDYGTTC